MKNRLIFPLFNALVCASFGALIGYYISRPAVSTLLGSLGGLLLGLLVELLLGRLGLTHWLYRRRVLLAAVIEILIATFVVGPYAYVIVETQADPHPVCCETPLDYGAEEYEEIHIQTNDGITLAGWYVPPHETPGAVIVLLHGARSDRRGTAWHARQFIQAGYGVLLYDQRALGESTGEMVSFGWLDGPDLLAVIDYLAGRPEVDAERIGVVGLSGRVIVAGGLEDFENRVSQKYAGVVAANAEIWLIEDAWHVGGPSVRPDEYSQRMLGFFKTSLEKEASR